MAASLGFEPRKRLRTRGLTVSGIATWERQLFYVAASLGFEPRQRDSESLVLPLHYEATSEQNKERCASLQVARNCRRESIYAAAIFFASSRISVPC